MPDLYRAAVKQSLSDLLEQAEALVDARLSEIATKGGPGSGRYPKGSGEGEDSDEEIFGESTYDGGVSGVKHDSKWKKKNGLVSISEIGDKEIDRKVDEVCKETGYDKNKIYMTKTLSPVLGEYKTGDDYIVLSPLATGDKLKGVLSHEVTHAQTADTIKEYFHQSRSGKSDTPIFKALSANVAECLDEDNGRFTEYIAKFSGNLQNDRSVRNKFYVISEGLAERSRMRVEGGKYPEAWDRLYEKVKGLK